MNTKNKTILYLLIALIVLLFYNNIFIFNQYTKQKKTNSILYEELENSYITIDEVLNRSLNDVRVYQSYNKFKPFIKNYNKQNSYLLVYRYSNKVCDGCVHEDLNNLEDFISIIGKESVLILPSFPDSRESKINLRNKLRKYNFINIPIDTFKLPDNMDGNGEHRFFALINKENEIKTVFFPIAKKSSFTKMFFDTIKDSFKND